MHSPLNDSCSEAIHAVGLEFTLKMTNNSLNSGSFCIYQEVPQVSNGTKCAQLAWYAKGCHPGNYVSFKWKVEYSLHWSQQGRLDGGVRYETGGIVKADLTKGERQNLTFEDGCCKFNGKAKNGPPGTIGINVDDTLRNDQCMIAVSVGNKAIAAIKVQPNTCITFSPIPTIFVTFGPIVEGTILDKVSTVEPLQLDFNKYGVRKLNISLNSYNEWETSRLNV